MRSVIPSQAPPEEQSSEAQLRAASKQLGRLASVRRTRPAYVKAGAGLVAVCGVGIGVAVAGISGRIPVLQMAGPVGAGHRVAAEDLRTVEVAADDGLGLIPAARQSEIIGRIAAVPLVAGDLVTDSKLGSSAKFPPVGEAVTSAALKAGAFPSELKAGDRVAVVMSADASASVSGAAAITPQPAISATVLTVTSTDTQGAVVVSLLTDQGSALRIGQAAASAMSLVVLAPSTAGGS